MQRDKQRHEGDRGGADAQEGIEMEGVEATCNRLLEQGSNAEQEDVERHGRERGQHEGLPDWGVTRGKSRRMGSVAVTAVWIPLSVGGV